MKKIVSLCILSLVVINTLNARRSWFFGWFHITPKLGIGNSLLMNSSMFDIDRVTPDIFNFAYTYGGQLGVAFMDKYDISFELNQNITNQFYSINMDNLGYDKKLKFKNLDYGIFFKLMTNTGYFEVGGMISKLNNIFITNTVATNPATDPIFQDNTDYFKGQHYKIIAGFGGTVYQIDLFEITLGLRINYGIQAMATGPEIPLLDNVYTGNLSNNSKTHSLSAMIELEIHHFFSYFGKAVCGSRSIIFERKPAKSW